MDKIDYRAISEQLHSDLDEKARDVDAYAFGLPMFDNEELLQSIQDSLKEAVQKAIEITLQTVANEAVVDYTVIPGKNYKGNIEPDEIEVYIVQGSLEEIKEKLLKQLL